ncbi:hypothetical protein [Halobacillus kuroshimensis]|uniref:hypothetical protein n=1 Tax=Halobacillus kuroshimensis TaxID=302481 RepID=UPI000686781F|nr:hypothetical protein [Halobacillus kuroshimensis]
MQNQAQAHGDQGGQFQGPQEQNLAQGYGDQGGQAQGPQEQSQSQGYGDIGGQTQGPQEQNQSQGYGDQGGQTQGPQEQNVSQGYGDQAGQTQGPQDLTQNQGYGDQGGQTQGPQEQNVSQGYGDQAGQTQGPQELTQTQGYGDQSGQNLEGHTNNSPLNNEQTIDTSVSGVTVNVTTTCEDDKDCGCYDYGCRGRKKGNGKSRSKECDCCTKNLSDLLEDIRTTQQTDPAGNPISIYLTAPEGDPIENQQIFNVNGCATVTYIEAGQTTAVPNATSQLCKVAGIQADDTSADVFALLTTLSNSCEEEYGSSCGCENCANGIGEDLACTTRFGIQINLNVEGQAAPIPDLFVQSICGCLGFFVDDLINPTVIYVFTLCSVTGYNVLSQTLGS